MGYLQISLEQHALFDADEVAMDDQCPTPHRRRHSQQHPEQDDGAVPKTKFRFQDRSRPRPQRFLPMNSNPWASQCAFCLAPSTLIWAPQQVLTATTFNPRRYAGIPRTASVARGPPHLAKRPRTQQPTARFNDNGPDNGFRNQTADLLLSAARFFRSSSGQAVLWAGLVWLALTGRIGFLFDSFVFLFAVLTVVPVIGLLVFRWWISRQLVEGVCPSCGSSVTGLKGQSVRCTGCGSSVEPEATGDFSVKDPSKATIDIVAKEVDDF